MGNLDHVRSYYEALNSGDFERVASHFTEDAVHYYTRLGPHEGARAIAENASWAVGQIEARWALEGGIEQGDEAAIEWSMTWRDPKSGAPRINRGAELFRFRDGRICEVRAYHHGDAKNPEGNLLGFDHAGRGHTVLAEGGEQPAPATREHPPEGRGGSMETVYGIGRLAFGAGLIAAPGQIGELLVGEEAHDRATRIALRTYGTRDVVLGLGTLRAVHAGGDTQHWLGAGIGADLLDASLQLAEWRDLPPGRRAAGTASALAAAAIGAALLLRRRRA